jgi:hypothetical protein
MVKMAASLSPKELLKQLRDLANNPTSEFLEDDSLRRDLRDASRDVSLALEAGGDAVHRLGSLVQHAKVSAGHTWLINY